MMISWQCRRWLSSLCLDVAVHLVVNLVAATLLLLLWLGGGSCLCFGSWLGELLLNLQVGVDGVHAEIQVGAVLLVVLGANMRTRLLGWSENVRRSATLNGTLKH